MINLKKTTPMKSFELMYITLPTEEADNQVFEIVKESITKFGKLHKVDVWGTKRLAYEVRDMVEGNYTLIAFENSSEGIKEIDRKLRQNENVLRHMIISKSL